MAESLRNHDGEQFRVGTRVRVSRAFCRHVGTDDRTEGVVAELVPQRRAARVVFDDGQETNLLVDNLERAVLPLVGVPDNAAQAALALEAQDRARQHRRKLTAARPAVVAAQGP